MESPCFNMVQTQALIYTYIHSPLWTHTLSLWAPPKDWAGISSWNLRSRRRHLVIDGNVSSHWMRIAGNPEINSEINVSTRSWTLVGWGYHSSSNHPTTGWFACIESPSLRIWRTLHGMHGYHLGSVVSGNNVAIYCIEEVRKDKILIN